MQSVFWHLLFAPRTLPTSLPGMSKREGPTELPIKETETAKPHLLLPKVQDSACQHLLSAPVPPQQAQTSPLGTRYKALTGSPVDSVMEQSPAIVCPAGSLTCLLAVPGIILASLSPQASPQAEAQTDVEIIDFY